MPELCVDLNAPGMTALHRAGAAGLYMTVNALEARGARPEGWEGWETTKQRVTLRWRGSAEVFFDALVKASFGFDKKDGLIDLAAIDRAKASDASRWIVHEGILGTFCQFGPNNGLGEARVLVLPVDEGQRPVHFTYRPIEPGRSKKGKSYPHRDAGGVEVGTAVDKRKSVALVGWLFPGAVIRHNAFANETMLDEDPARALSLVYAPAGCFYFKIQSRRQERKARFALLVPDIDDLERYAAARLAATTDVKLGELFSTSAGDAALRLLTRLRARTFANEARLPSVSVILLGTVVWNEKQKSRTAVMEVAARGDEALKRFNAIRAELPARSGMRKDGTSYVLLPAPLELFADNLAEGRPFYEGFASLMINKEIREWIPLDRKGLAKVVEREEVFDEDREVLFVKACHEALRRSYGIVADRAKSDRVDVNARFKKEYERWRNAFARAKSAETFREAITDFWSRGGSNSLLRERWKEVLPMLSPARWKQGRDLALLALASYARAEGEGEPEGEPIEETEGERA
jgi:CRISPR-associated protein Cas8a1/Csx13